MSEILKNHPFPVDTTAVRVMFSKGTHFQPKLVLTGKKSSKTMDAPPKPIKLKGQDFAGLRRGNMTAFQQYSYEVLRSKMERQIRKLAEWEARPEHDKRSKKPKVSPIIKNIWVCRCDCGKYELRDIGAFYGTKTEDKCSVCKALKLNRNGINQTQSLGKLNFFAKQNRLRERFLTFGLSKEEIALLAVNNRFTPKWLVKFRRMGLERAKSEISKLLAVS